MRFHVSTRSGLCLNRLRASVVFCALLFIVFAGPAKAQVNTADSLALVDFYMATGGTAWNNSNNWLTGPVDSWFGVRVAGGRVRSLQMLNNDLSGTVPASLSALDALDTLRLSKNTIQGVESLGGLEKLRFLALDRNPLTEIPPLFDLLKLRELNLSECQLTWVPNLSSCTGLALLNLSKNQLANMPGLGAIDSLLEVNVADNALDEFPAVNQPLLSLLDVSGNALEFDDLETLLGQIPSGVTFKTEDQAVAGAPQFVYNNAGPLDPVFMTVPLTGANTEYEWFYGSSSITGPSPLDNGVALGCLFGCPPALNGTYQCRMTNPLFPGTEIRYAPFTLESSPSPPFTVSPGVGDVINSSVPLTYIDNFVLESTLFIQGSSDVTFSNCTIWVCNPNAGIVVEDIADLTLNNVVLRPCEGDAYWAGIDIDDNAAIDMDGSSVYHAAYGVDIQAFSINSINGSEFINCNTGVRLLGPSPFGSTVVDQIDGNRFLINDAVPDFSGAAGVDPTDFAGVSVRDRNLGTFGFSSGVKNNVFANQTAITCFDYCGIIAENAGIVIEKNTYIDMYCGVDMSQPQSTSVVMGDSVVNLNVADCTAVSHKFENSNQPVLLTGSTLITTPSPYDSIFIGAAAINCTNWVEFSNNSFSHFDHSQVLDSDFRVRILDNAMHGGYVGAYFRNTRKLNYQCNATTDIFCGSAYRVDNNLLNFIEANYPNWFNMQLNFRWNGITPPPYNPQNGTDPDHDDEYSMRFFGCPAANPTVACGPGEGITVAVQAPDVSANAMDSLRVEFTLDQPPAPFGNPSPGCDPGSPRYAPRFERPRNWVRFVESTPGGLGDFEADLHLLASQETTAAASSGTLVLHPNPGSNGFHLASGEGGLLQFYNSQGQLRHSVQVQGRQWVNAPVQPGLYQIVLLGHDGSTHQGSWIKQP